ncbi:MAG: DNA alkylation repair enzyme [Rikenellaceae bacterium]|nr:DNA alkylation repair enzyme [Rikenellaceae bacterium]
MFEQKKRLLLFRLRKEMNGAALDTMRYFGADYERNYGVQIYAIRNLAREIGTDHELAEYFYTQNIREVRLVALWIADAERVAAPDFDFWASGIINSEVAEQASHALLSRIADVAELLQRWSSSDNALLAYCALLSAARNGGVESATVVNAIVQAVTTFSDNRLVAQGATALTINLPDEAIKNLLQNLPNNPTSQLLKDEVAWRL